MGNVNSEIVAFYKQLGFTLIEIKSSVFRVENSTFVLQTDHKDHTVDASTILYKDAEKIFALTEQRTALLTQLREWADSRIKPQEHGKDCLGEYCDSAFCNWDDISHTNKEMELLKNHINNLINPTNV